MTHRPSQDPYGGKVPMVDKMIGNAFDVVKYVAHYLKEIRYVAYNMEDVHRVSQELRANVQLKTPINAVNAVFTIPLPEGVSAGSVMGSDVIVTTIENEVYGPSANTFSWVIKNGQLEVTIPLNAPASFVGSEIRWMLTWNAPR